MAGDILISRIHNFPTMKNTKSAFNWIISILQKHKLPYRISGGFAARIYGSKRKLSGIDIDTIDMALNKVLPDVQKYALHNPNRYKGREWDCYYLGLRYKGQEIGLMGVNHAKIVDKTKQKWIRYKVDFSKVSKKKVYGKISLTSLISTLRLIFCL